MSRQRRSSFTREYKAVVGESDRRSQPGRFNAANYVEELHVESFRGLPQLVVLPIAVPIARVSAPATTIVLGDNGSGKSSFADALEFALQSRIGRRWPKQACIATVQSGRIPRTKVVFHDGHAFEREFLADEGPRPAHTLEPWRGAPVVIRRADILMFWNTDALSRLAVFTGFLFRPSAQSASNAMLPTIAPGRLRELKRTQYEAKERRRALVRQLASHLRVDQEVVPIQIQQLNEFARAHLYGGLTRKQRRRLASKGIHHTIDETARRLVYELREAVSEVKKLKAEISQTMRPETSGGQKWDRLAEVTRNVAYRAEKAFKEITTAASLVDHVEILVAKDNRASLDVELHLSTGQSVSPTDTLSEANLDILAFAVYLGFAMEAASQGQAPFLVLDDVFQSVDATLRRRAFEWMLDNTAGWQIVMTAHERLWVEQMADAVRRRGGSVEVHHVGDWTVDRGPVLTVNKSTGLPSSLAEAFGRRDTAAICGAAGVVLEQACNELSFELPCAIMRRRGERYTLGDLWPPVRKKLKKTNLKAVTDRVDRTLALRNLVGAHYNDWAQSVSDAEARELGSAVMELVARVRCDACASWVSGLSHRGRVVGWRCKCGAVSFEARS